MRFTLLLYCFAGCIVTRLHTVAGHRSDVDDVSVLLTVKTFTLIGSKPDEQPSVAEEVTDQAHSSLSEDLWELDQLTKSAAEVSDYDVGYAFRSLGIRPPLILLTVLGVLLLACGCACVCGRLGRRASSRRQVGGTFLASNNSGLHEVWTRPTRKKVWERLADIFDLLDEGEQTEANPPGFIRKEDVVKAIADPQVASDFAHIGISMKKSLSLFMLLDTDRDGLVDAHHFIKGLMNLGVEDNNTMSNSLHMRD